MSAIYRQYKGLGLEVLFAAVNANPDVVEFAGRYKLPFPVGIGDGDKGRALFEFPMVRPAYVPWLAFIDRKGFIRAQFSGTDSIFKEGAQGVIRQIEPLLAEKASAAGKSAPKKK